MNKLLVRTLEFLNGFIAFFILVPCIMVGAGFGRAHGLGIIGAIAGGLIGLVLTALICGAISFLSLIERHLSRIANATGEVTANLRILAKSAILQNAVAEMQIAAHEDDLTTRHGDRRVS